MRYPIAVAWLTALCLAGCNAQRDPLVVYEPAYSHVRADTASHDDVTRDATTDHYSDDEERLAASRIVR